MPNIWDISYKILAAQLIGIAIDRRCIPWWRSVPRSLISASEDFISFRWEKQQLLSHSVPEKPWPGWWFLVFLKKFKKIKKIKHLLKQWLRQRRCTRTPSTPCRYFMLFVCYQSENCHLVPYKITPLRSRNRNKSSALSSRTPSPISPHPHAEHASESLQNQTHTKFCS